MKVFRKKIEYDRVGFWPLTEWDFATRFIVKPKSSFSPKGFEGVAPDEFEKMYPPKKRRTFEFDSVEYFNSGREVACRKKALLCNGAVLKPLYAYQHGGSTISTSPFSCPWDSGQCGWVVIDREKVQAEFGGDHRKAAACLEAEVRTIALALEGEIYAYVIEVAEVEDPDDYDEDEAEWEVAESCGGYIGRDHCETEAQQSLEYEQKKEEKRLEKEKEEERLCFQACAL